MTELEHWPYKIYKDDSGTLYVHDLEEGLVFQREKIRSGKYGLAVIIEEDNATYPCLIDILSPEPPCGFQVFDKITAGEWSGLVKDYLRHKRKGESRFNAWLKGNLYDKIGKFLYEGSFIAESMPFPEAPESEWEDFERATKIFEKERAQ